MGPSRAVSIRLVTNPQDSKAPRRHLNCVALRLDETPVMSNSQLIALGLALLIPNLAMIALIWAQDMRRPSNAGDGDN